MRKILAFLVLLTLGVVCNDYRVSAVEDLTPQAKSSILIEAKSGMILAKKNEHFRLAPASMTKIMSAILIAEQIDKGNLKLEDMITTTEHAKSMGGSQVFLEVGEQLTLDDMLKCILICSANDATVAVAEHISGSEALFVEAMNERAKEIGCKNTNFLDCTGLTTINHYSSAYDMALMSRHLINNYGDLVLKYTSTYDDYIREDTDKQFWLVNTNKLINKVEGVDGLKTGWTQEAGYCLAATMLKKDMRLISVIMGETTAQIRNTETVQLLNYGYANYETRVILDKQTVIAHIKDIRYKPMTFDLMLKEDIMILVKKSDDVKNVRYEIIEFPKYEADKAGKLKVFYGNDELGVYEFDAQVEVKKRNFWEIIVEVFREFLS